MPSLTFSAAIEDFAEATKADLEAVFKESTQRTISLAQSYVPVDTGFLRASIRASTSSMPKFTAAAPKAGESYAPPSDYVLVIAGAKLGMTLFVGYTANYAGHVEYGTDRMTGRAFVGRAALRWSQTVEAVVAELRARRQGRA
jgi:hypothetical protein